MKTPWAVNQEFLCLRYFVAVLGSSCTFINDHLCLQMGNTALLLAAHQGHIEVVEALLKHGASVNLQNDVSMDFEGEEAIILHSIFIS